MRIKNRQQLLATVHGVLSPDTYSELKAAKTGEDAANIIESNLDVKGLSRSDIVTIWTAKPELDATKTVRISVEADAGEEVEVTSPQAEPEPAETNMEGEDEEDMEGKAAKPAPRKKAGEFGAKIARAGAAAKGFGKPMNATSRKHKAYNAAVSRGTPYRGGKYKTVFSDGEEADVFGAWLRTTAFPVLEYAGKARDLDIVTSSGIKALGGNINETGGFAVPDVFDSSLIELLPGYTAVRRAVGVKDIIGGSWVGPRVDDDVEFSVVGENQAATDQSNPTGSNVRLDPREIIGLVRASQSWLADSAIDAADMIANSMMRGAGKFIDLNCLRVRGTTVASQATSPSFQGAEDKLGSNTKIDAAYSAWGDFTVSDDTSLRGLVSDRAHSLDVDLGYIMSGSYYAANFEKLGLSGGGVTPLDFTAGTRNEERMAQLQADAIWNGKPVWFSSAMPTAYVADQTGAMYGAWSAACKYGEVPGSLAVASSEQRYFEYGQTGFRMLLRAAFNAHDVNDSVDPESGSLIVGLQD
jgi:HK97 family phage major capsid protein